MRAKATPFEYLLKCSQMSLQDFELARLDRVASLRKQLRDIAEEWVEAAVEAQLARWVRENREQTAARPANFRPCIHEREARKKPLQIGLHSKPTAALASLPAPVLISTKQSCASSRRGLQSSRRSFRGPHPDAFAALRNFSRDDESQ